LECAISERPSWGVGCDKLNWQLNGSSVFDIHLITRCFEESLLSLSLGRVFDVLRLLSGFSLVGWCGMCRCSGETVAHLLKHCEVAYVMGCGVEFLGLLDCSG
jgi:hypothetical protein